MSRRTEVVMCKDRPKRPILSLIVEQRIDGPELNGGLRTIPVLTIGWLSKDRISGRADHRHATIGFDRAIRLGVIVIHLLHDKLLLRGGLVDVARRRIEPIQASFFV